MLKWPKHLTSGSLHTMAYQDKPTNCIFLDNTHLRKNTEELAIFFDDTVLAIQAYRDTLVFFFPNKDYQEMLEKFNVKLNELICQHESQL